MENETIFCPQCGTKNAATNAFCFACGTPLSRAGKPPVPPEPPKSEPPKPEPNEFDAPTEVLDPSEFPDLTEPSAPPENAFRPAELNEFDAPTELLDEGIRFAPPEDLGRPAEPNDFGAPTEVLGQGGFANPLEPSEPAPRSAPNEFDVPMGGFGQDGFTDPIDPSATPEPSFRPATYSVRKAFASSAAAVALTLLTVFTCATLLRELGYGAFRTVTQDLPKIFDAFEDVFDEAPTLLLYAAGSILTLLHIAFLTIVLLGGWLAFFGATKRGCGMQTGGLIVVRIGAIAAFLASFLNLAILVAELILDEKAVNADLAPLPKLETAELVWQILTIASAVLLPVLYLLLFHATGGMKRVVRTENPRERVSLVVPSVFLLLLGCLKVVDVVLESFRMDIFSDDIWGNAVWSLFFLQGGFFDLVLAVGLFVLAGFLLKLRGQLKRSSTAE